MLEGKVILCAAVTNFITSVSSCRKQDIHTQMHWGMTQCWHEFYIRPVIQSSILQFLVFNHTSPNAHSSIFKPTAASLVRCFTNINRILPYFVVLHHNISGPNSLYSFHTFIAHRRFNVISVYSSFFIFFLSISRHKTKLLFWEK
jgi:hypothetical protein